MSRGMLIATILAIAFGVFWFAYYKDIYLEGKKSVETLKIEGWELYDANKVDEAVKKFKMAIEKDSKYPLTHFGLGSCYNQQGEYEKAKECFAKALELKPDYHTARISYARCLVRSAKNRAEASAIIRQELAKIPREAYQDANVLYNLSTLHAVNQNYNEALESLRLAIQSVSAMRNDARKDKDFENLRNSSIFKNYVGQK